MNTAEKYPVTYDFYPDFSYMILDHWRRYSKEGFTEQLDLLKKKHPDAEAIRITHSYDAFLRDSALYVSRWEQMLSICAGSGIRVVCALFNRLHNPMADAGGIYLEQLIPGISWAYKEGFYAEFVRSIAGNYGDDDRIFCFQSCIKPLGAFRDPGDDPLSSRVYELRWLREVYCYMKKINVQKPICLDEQDWFTEREQEEIAYACDFPCISPYTGEIERTEAFFKTADDKKYRILNP